MDTYYIAWWNLENLFDTVGSTERPEWLKERLKKELEGWTTNVLSKKLKQLAKVIDAMNDGKGPDILGVCEVENKKVLEKLVATLGVGRDYGIAHHDMSDKRGIDVAFIYDKNLFTAHETFARVILRRNATRDLFQVNFKTANNRELVCIGNHWPSRSGGEEASAPYRMMAGETLSYWMERITSHLGEEVPVLVMGDFNDEPFDRSMADYALSERTKRRVVSKRSKKPYLYNLSWPLMGKGEGTHFYNHWGMLDQILVNKDLLNSQLPIRYVEDSFTITKTQVMLKKGKPRRFSRPSARGGIDETGYSDHLPVSILINETNP